METAPPISKLKKNMPYGPNVDDIPVKKECINHITKRMGTGLRALLRDYKGETHFRKTRQEGKNVSNLYPHFSNSYIL